MGSARADCANLILPRGQSFLIYLETEGNVGAKNCVLCECRSRYHEQTEHAQETESLLFHKSSFAWRTATTFCVNGWLPLNATAVRLAPSKVLITFALFPIATTMPQCARGHDRDPSSA